MAERKVHLTGRYYEGVAVPFCETKGRGSYVTSSPSHVDCLRCINKWNKEVNNKQGKQGNAQ
jgi:hypothetical protein